MDAGAGSPAVQQSAQPIAAFETYEQAIEYARRLTCVSTEMTRSSWIRGAEFCSAEGSSGYLLVDLKDRWYIHEGVPVDVWSAFKTAASPGGFYNQNLRSRYRLKLSERK